MPIFLVDRKITEIKCNAIINFTDENYSGQYSSDTYAYYIDGEGYGIRWARLQPLKPGEVSIMREYNLHYDCVNYFIHTTYPQPGKNELHTLKRFFSLQMEAVQKFHIRSIALTTDSAGFFSLSKTDFLYYVLRIINSNLMEYGSDLTVYICTDNDYDLIDDDELQDYIQEKEELQRLLRDDPEAYYSYLSRYAPRFCLDDSRFITLGELIEKREDSFAERLQKLIKERNLSEVECYKRANVHRRTYSRIKNDPNYKPSKATALAFAISLQLSIYETERLLKTAGFSLSDSEKFDIIIKFYISKGIYDIYEINSALYKYGENCLGC